MSIIERRPMTDETAEAQVKIMLVDAEAMARAHPTTFHIRPQAERETLQPGDLAKLCFETVDGSITGERMWVRVEVAACGLYRGTLANDPVGLPLAFGDPWVFDPRHIYDITRAPLAVAVTGGTFYLDGDIVARARRQYELHQAQYEALVSANLLPPAGVDEFITDDLREQIETRTQALLAWAARYKVKIVRSLNSWRSAVPSCWDFYNRTTADDRRWDFDAPYDEAGAREHEVERARRYRAATAALVERFPPDERPGVRAALKPLAQLLAAWGVLRSGAGVWRPAGAAAPTPQLL